VSLIRSKHEVREFQPENIQKVLFCLKNEHEEFYLDDPNLCEYWPRMEEMWHSIENEIRAQVSGKIIGSLQSIRSLRLVEELAKSPDPIINLSATLMDKAILNGLLKCRDLEQVVDDWFVTKFNRIPYFLPCRSTNHCCLHFPNLIERYARGYPSPRAVEREWNLLTSGFEMYEFQTLLQGNLLFFSFSLPPFEGDPCEPPSEYRKTGLELIRLARGAPV
jgi:hypothetical protein